MRFSTIAAALFAVVGSVSAATHTVIVGSNGTLTYSPSSVMAAAGDVVQFQFMPKNHTVTQSTFAAPCTKNPTSDVSSGFLAVAANATSHFQWSITVNNASTPLWFYCAQANHCSSGMVFAINPTADKSFEKYLANAKATAPASSAASSAAPAAKASSAASSSAAAPVAAAADNAPGTAAASVLGNSGTKQTGSVVSMLMAIAVLGLML